MSATPLTTVFATAPDAVVVVRAPAVISPPSPVSSVVVVVVA
ncbi:MULTISPECIES: hypothetical protein [unclassified Pseudomonas]|nr:MULTISPECIES: hypothetical protein [unclassified Pseudomonas]MCU1722487.1 hypothetical protein [Pseudomonas sp. 5P_5.1_Bac1]